MKKSFRCIFCNGKSFNIRFKYNSPPIGETKFKIKNNYYKRQFISCNSCNHWFLQHEMSLNILYSGKYMTETYGDKILGKFEKIISLPPKKSDNFKRVQRIKKFIKQLLPNKKSIELLDIGSGLGVFPYSVKNIGWNCTAVDPDKRSVLHIKKRIGVKSIHGEFQKLKISKKFNVITLNKVLEHVENPISILRKAKKRLIKGGVIYVEVPDAEKASKKGKERQEFFIEHMHVFSKSSLGYMSKKSGLKVIKIKRMHEPSGKFSLFSFLK